MHLDRRLIAVPTLALALTGTAGAQAGDMPLIIAIAVNPVPLHPGSEVEAVVNTSPDVTAVEARVRGFKFTLNQAQAGEFRTTGKVPKIARFFKGTYHVTFIARTNDGQTAEDTHDVILN